MLDRNLKIAFCLIKVWTNSAGDVKWKRLELEEVINSKGWFCL
jgi:hypothetical protein